MFLSCQVESLCSRGWVLARSRSATVLPIVPGGKASHNSTSHLTLLLTRFQHCLMKHAGVSAMISSLRNQFWILGVRRLAKRVKRECMHCKRQDSSPCPQPMSPYLIFELLSLSHSQWLVWTTQVLYVAAIFPIRNSGCCSLLVGDPCCAPWVSWVAVHWIVIVGITPFSCMLRAATCDLLRHCKGLLCHPSAVTKTVRPCGPWLEIYCPAFPMVRRLVGTIDPFN